MSDAKPAAEAAVAEKPRPETIFVVLTRTKGETLWSVLPTKFVGRTQDEAKRKAARALSEDSEYAPAIQGDGLEIAVTSARSFKPVLVKVEPQPAKVVVRS